VNFGVLVETEEGLDWDRWRSTYATAERLGFESVWISDHLQSPWSVVRHGLDPWTALAVCAAETRRIVLGPLVSPITFREPVIVARMAESLDSLSGGRFVIGLGLGWNADEHAAAGIDFPASGQRSALLEAGLLRIRAELAGRRIPILIGGAGRTSTLPLVARLADEWNVTTSSLAYYTRASDELDRECRAIGRDPREIRRSVAAGVLVSGHAQRLREVVPPLAGAEDLEVAAREMGWFVGPLDSIAAQVKGFEDAGVQRVVFGVYDLDDTGLLECLAEGLMPRIQ
jgi:alkanesulfonate monooxygenase SsuD/methylene tetrahydromethanopterin reductase-like flavin-dependent oxidoreductase (luciferase family)